MAPPSRLRRAFPYCLALLARLAAPAAAETRETPNLDLARPAVRQALDRVASAELGLPAFPPGSQELTPATLGAIDRFARQRVGQVDALVSAAAQGRPTAPENPELGQDLAALELLKEALPSELRLAVDDSNLAYRSERLQSAIAAARQWSAERRLAPERVPTTVRPGPGLSPPDRHAPAPQEALRAPAPPAPRRVEQTAPPAWQGVWSKLWRRLRPRARRADSDSVSLGRLMSAARALANLSEADQRAYRLRYDGLFERPDQLAKLLDELERRESLPPARLDTLIYHQAGERDDAIVELVNNGIDTLFEKAGLLELVGRFGVGAFQVLQELESPGDRVVVETAVRPGLVRRLTFSIPAQARPREAARSIRISLGSTRDPAFERGTRVRVVKAQGLSRERQAGLRAKLAARLGQSARARVMVNGQLINPLDGWKDVRGHRVLHRLSETVEVSITDLGYQLRDLGLGMDAPTLLEKFLVPRRSTKGMPTSTRTRLLYRGDPDGKPGELTTMAVTLAVAGVAVERFEVEGLQLPEAVVLELPPGSWLPESRNKITVTPQVWAGLRSVTEGVLRGDLERDVGLLNALTAVVAHLENPRTHPEAEKSGEDFARAMADRLDRAPGLKRVAGFSGSRRAYTMPFKDKSRVYLEYGSSLIFDEEVYARYKDDPLLLNLVMNFHVGYGDQKPAKGLFAAPAKDEPATARPDDGVQSALAQAPWFSALPADARASASHYLQALLARSPPVERPAALAAEMERLGAVGRLAQDLLPGLDWTRGLLGVKDPAPVGEAFARVFPFLEPKWIAGEVALLALNERSTVLYHGGKPVLPKERFDHVRGPFEVDGKLCFFALKGRRWHAYWDGRLRWEGEAEPGAPALIGGKLAFFLREGKRITLRVGDRDAWSHEPADRPAQLIPVGAGWAALVNQNPTASEHLQEIYQDGRLLWSGAAIDLESQLIDAGGRLVFMTAPRSSKKSLPGLRVYLDGQLVQNFEDASGGSLVRVGDKLVERVRQGEKNSLYVIDRPRIESAHRSGFLSWSDNLSSQSAFDIVSPLVAVDGHVAFSDLHIGPRVQKAYDVFLDGRRVWSGQGYDIGDSLQVEGIAGAEVVLLERRGGRHRLIAGNRTIQEAPEGEEISHVAVSGDRIAYVMGREGREQLYASPAGDASAVRLEPLSEPAAKTFARAHAFDLEDAGRPWGRRFLSNLLHGWGPATPSQALPALPFLDGAELRELSPQTLARFSALAAAEPWPKVEELAQFLRLTRGLTQEAAERDRWFNRWLTLAEADWGRAKQLLAQLQKRYPIGEENAFFAGRPDEGQIQITLEIASSKPLPEKGKVAVQALLAKIGRPQIHQGTLRWRQRHPAKKLADLLNAFAQRGPMLGVDLAQRANGSVERMTLFDHTTGLRVIFDENAMAAIHEVTRRAPDKTALELLEALGGVIQLGLPAARMPADLGRRDDSVEGAGPNFFQEKPEPAAKTIAGTDFLRRDVDVRQAPGHLRGYLYFLRSAHAELLKERPAEPAPADQVEESLEPFPLALLTMAKRQRADRLGKPALSLSGFGKVLKSLLGYSTKALDEELESAIRGQDQGDLAWTRELIQNARDALRRAWREKTLPQGQGEVAVESYRSGGDWIVEVRDPVGMSLSTLANTFFPLDESDKVRGVDGGQFGQGLYALFGDFDEVRIRTSDGSRAFDIAVSRDAAGQLLVTKWVQRAGGERGTRIQRVKRMNRVQDVLPELEAAFVTQAVYEHAGSVQDVAIRYQGEKINETLTEEAALDVAPWGRLRVLGSPSRLSRVTQDGLTVIDPGLRAELLALLPDWMRRLWQDNGWTIELPQALPVARSRSGLAQKERTLAPLQRAVLAASVPLAVKLSLEDSSGRRALPGLPQDFYDNAAYQTSAQTLRDGEHLAAGHWERLDWDRYLADSQAFSELVAVTPVRLGGQTLSLWSARQEVLAGRPPTALSVLGDSIKQALAAASARLAETAAALPKPSKRYSSKEVDASRPLRDFRDLNLELLRLLGEKDWTAEFYERADAVAAHFEPGKRAVFWNLRHSQALVDRWQAVLAGDDGEVDPFFYDFLEILLHEYTHHTDQGWTHHADEHLEGGFAWRMRRNIEKLIRAHADLRGLVRQARARR